MIETAGAKMMYLIKRKPTTTRDELVAHWFANHMPGVIERQQTATANGRLHATRYLATLFQPGPQGRQPWDGVAQLWWPRPLPRPLSKPGAGFGAQPRDTFQQKVEPYLPWATREYVVIDGADQLSTAPLTLNAPYPTTRSGFLKITYLVAAKPAADREEFLRHWLRIHVPNVEAIMKHAGGFRYVVSHSMADDEPYAGMAELYFHDAGGWERWREVIEPDGMERWMDGERTLALCADTEMVGIP